MSRPTVFITSALQTNSALKDLEIEQDVTHAEQWVRANKVNHPPWGAIRGLCVLGPAIDFLHVLPHPFPE